MENVNIFSIECIPKDNTSHHKAGDHWTGDEETSIADNECKPATKGLSVRAKAFSIRSLLADSGNTTNRNRVTEHVRCDF